MFRINDNIGSDDKYEVKIGTLQEFKDELNNFLIEFGEIEQGECEKEIQDNFFFYTNDDGYSGSYWCVDDFGFIVNDNEVIIQINDWE